MHAQRPAGSDEGVRGKRTERAFVVELDPPSGARSRLRGRAELVASGEVIHFRSAKQLIVFMDGILRRWNCSHNRACNREGEDR